MPAGRSSTGPSKAALDAYTLLTELIWPTMELVQSLYREDRISISSLNLATRLNRRSPTSSAPSLHREALQRPQGPDLLRRR